MRANIQRVGAVGGMAYGACFTLCGNDEVIRLRIANSWPDGVCSKDATAAAMDAAKSVIIKSGYDYRSESSFQAYNGGRRHQLIEVDWFMAVLDDDDNPIEWESTTDVPKDLFAEGDAVSDAAYEAMHTEMERQVQSELSRIDD